MKKHFLSICAIIRNEAPYLSEWLAFHRLQGVEHFYIYHNVPDLKSDTDTSRVLIKEWQEHKDITSKIWAGERQQCIVYNDCLKNYGIGSEWIAFIDIDEFLWTPKYKTMIEAFDYICRDNTAAIAVHWELFGSNGHKEKTDGLVIERFTRRGSSTNHHVKSVVRPHGIASAGKNPHVFYCKEGFRCINERGVDLPVEYAQTPNGSTDILRINHYHTKSFAEYLARKRLGDVNSGKRYSDKDIEQKFRAHDVNDVEDTALKDWHADRIKKVLC